MAETHECLFPEEAEPSGRLILAPCLTCGFTALDALDQLRRDLELAHIGEKQMVREIVDSLKLLGVEDPDPEDHLPTLIAKHDREVAAGAVERLADSAAINAAGILGPWDDIVFAWLRKEAASLRTSDDAAPGGVS